MATNLRDPYSAPAKIVHREIFREVMKTFIDYNDAVFNIIENQMDVTDETSIQFFVTKVRKDPACQALLSLLNSGSLTALKLFDALRQSEPSKNQTANHPATTSAGIAPPPNPEATNPSTPEATAAAAAAAAAEAAAAAATVPSQPRTSVVVIDQSPAGPTVNPQTDSFDAAQNACSNRGHSESPDSVEVLSNDPSRKKRKVSPESPIDHFRTSSIDELMSIGEQMLSSSTSEREKAMATQMLHAAIHRSQTENTDSSTKLQLAYILHDGIGGIKQDLRRASRLYECVLAEEWNCSAARNLARILMDGANGIGTADFVKAARLFDEVIKNGESDSVKGLAMSDLGLMYMFGANGVSSDTKRALSLWETASSPTYNTAAAMVNLGNVYCIGVGRVEKNLNKAIALYEKAIKLDNQSEAMCNLAILLQHGLPNVLPADVCAAVKLHERAICEEAHVQSMIELGILLTIGKGGIVRDSDRAATLFERALEKSWEDGRRIRDFLTCGSTLADFRCS